LRYFKKLVDLGYKEIEVSFPSASKVDFDFTRDLIQDPGTVPDDVWIQVLSPCREDFIKTTVESVKGAKKAIVHLYLATSECFRRVVFGGMSEEETLNLAVKSTELVRELTDKYPNTEWAYEFSPEVFSDSRLEFVIRVCEAVKAAWGPTEENPIIFNLPATVEMATPNVYADQIEFFCRNITERKKVCVSVHPHNDRGCAVAAAELAQMGGADRVEGCLFGNGERTGNVDLVTLALNLYTQGIHPKVDFSEITEVINIVEDCTKIPVHARAPYGGQLVVCAFSGSHQDAIKKGFDERKKSRVADDAHWVMPYLPLDPADIGRTYEAVIRVNSQSGKGGVAWIIQRALELDMPRGLQVAFSKVVQKEAEAAGRELKPEEIQALFENEYHLKQASRIHLVDYEFSTDRSVSPIPGMGMASANSRRTFVGIISMDGREHSIRGIGNGPISSLANALRCIGVELDVKDYKEHAIGQGRDVKAATFIECIVGGSSSGPQTFWGVGIHEDAAQASLIAILSAASSVCAQDLHRGDQMLTTTQVVSSRPGTPMPLAPKAENGLTVVAPATDASTVRVSINGLEKWAGGI
jgi:2-isopropylmalate synthase